MKGKNFKFLCEAYPDWIENVRMMNAAYRSVVGLQRKIREFLKLKKERAGRKNTLENEIDTIEKAIPTEPKEEEKKPEEKKEEKPNVDKEPPKTSLSVPTNRTSSKNNRSTLILKI